MKRICLLMLLLAGLCACARAQVLTYGGSGDDVIEYCTVNAEGLTVMAGYTTSSDGTLSDRTKTGRSGWVMCLNAQGEVLWNFCSRHDVMDEMICPVIHEDGTISVILITVNPAMEQLGEEWIHLSGDGRVLEREDLAGEGGIVLHAGAEGYLQAQTGETERMFYLIPWGGTQRRLLEVQADPYAQLEAVSGRYLLMESLDAGRELLALDEGRANEWAVRSGVPKGRDYRRILALEDGGLAAVGRANPGFGAQFIFTRWDAQGNVLADTALKTVDLPRLICATERGFALLDFWGNLTLTDESGGILSTRQLALPGNARAMQPLPGGRVLIACVSGEAGEQDVRVLVESLE